MPAGFAYRVDIAFAVYEPQWAYKTALFMLNGSVTSNSSSPTPVSYTHLDVYKRQTLANVLREWYYT